MIALGSIPVLTTVSLLTHKCGTPAFTQVVVHPFRLFRGFQCTALTLLWLVHAVVSRTVCSLLVYRNTVDYCILV